MDLTNPKIWTLGESIKDILENLPSVHSGEEPMFNHVNHGFTTPDTRSADNMPFACILAPEKGRFESKNGMAIDNISLTLPVFAFFYIPEPANAIKAMYRYIQLFSFEIQDMNFSWFDETITVVPGEFAIGDVLKSNHDKNQRLRPPFYGVHLKLNVRINDSSI